MAGAKKRSKRKAGYAPSLLVGKPEYAEMKAYDGPPTRPYPIKLRELIELPPKTIMRKPELLPPYTEVSINQTEEALDLDELRSYGRYVLLSYDGDRTKALISNNITEPVEIENPQYTRTLMMNATLERSNQQAQERFNAETAQYEKAIADYNAKHGTGLKETELEVEPIRGMSKYPRVSASDLSDWNTWNNMSIDPGPPQVPEPAGYTRWERAAAAPERKYSGLNIGESREVPLEVTDEEE